MGLVEPLMVDWIMGRRAAVWHSLWTAQYRVPSGATSSQNYDRMSEDYCFMHAGKNGDAHRRNGEDGVTNLGSPHRSAPSCLYPSCTLQSVLA